jgi:hypothetical protein
MVGLEEGEDVLHRIPPERLHPSARPGHDEDTIRYILIFSLAKWKLAAVRSHRCIEVDAGSGVLETLLAMAHKLASVGRHGKEKARSRRGVRRTEKVKMGRTGRE